MRTHLYKAIRKDIGEWITGNFVKHEKTTYCFKEDYEKNPDNTIYYIAFDEPTDWGLPNRHLVTEVFPETICEAVDGLFTTTGDKRQLFEGDRVNIRTGSYYFRDYIIRWSESNLSWVAVRSCQKPCAEGSGLDIIRLHNSWEYEYLGNEFDNFESEEENDEC